MKKFAETLKRSFHKAVALLVAVLLKPGAVWNPENFKLWESRGYHITPVHFYSPIPDTRNLIEKDYQVSVFPELEMSAESQRKLLKEYFSRFSQEYDAIPDKQTDSKAFYLDNDAFVGTDPYIYYCMIRHFQPKTIIEVGSGHSTVLGAQASKVNESTRYICIDPWPRDFISQGITGVEFIQRKVEDLELEMFLQLKENDILFVDSSHVTRVGGDVNFIILEVVPRLAKGVIIHFHDIFLPDNYPKEWIDEMHRFWTEQYLLQAYLANNCHIEILFANHFISKKFTEDLRATFPKALKIGGGSFWIRKC